MKVKILSEHGYEQSLLGLSLSYNQPVENMPKVANRLYELGDGHNKFLESIVVWIDVTAPRYFWQQFDTYRIGITKQSESTMHTILKNGLTQDNFEGRISVQFLFELNASIVNKDFVRIKRHLPESFLQRRIICTNYKTIRHIIRQRSTHKLQEWQAFIDYMLANLEHHEFVADLQEKRNES